MAAATRPVYLIAHRINEGANVAKALGEGATAIECDVRWDDDDGWLVYHGPVRPPSVESAGYWLNVPGKPPTPSGSSSPFSTLTSRMQRAPRRLRRSATSCARSCLQT